MKGILPILLLLVANHVFAAQEYVTGPRDRTNISWTRPTQYTDGSPLPASEALSYQVYRNGIQVLSTSSLSHVLLDETPGLQCYTVTAKVLATGLESAHSAQICKMQVFSGPTEGSIIRR